MIVTRSLFKTVVENLAREKELALDTETLGLRTYHGDHLFSIIISTQWEAYYFNFQTYPEETTHEEVLTPHEHFQALRSWLFWDPEKIWFVQNAGNFDLGVLAIEHLELNGTIHCTKAIGRVEYNAHQSYSLADQLTRIGDKKDDAVEKYIEEHDLKTKVNVPGKGKEVVLKHFDRVPFKIIVPYGEQDALGTFRLGKTQIASILKQDTEVTAPKFRTVTQVMENERRLQKTIFNMRHRGVLIDRVYCEKAIKFENDRAEKATAKFKKETGKEYAASPTLFAEVFAIEKENWSYTDKGNPSFDADALERLESPAAIAVVELRDAKAKSDFYHGFLYHADATGAVHPNYNPEGTVHGRFSSSEPNFQNLKREDKKTPQEFEVRKALIPRPGHIFFLPDYSQMEYKFMLEQACILAGEKTALAKLICDGMDFHDATGLNIKNFAGLDLPREQIKITNFMTLYGSGIQNIADTLKIPFDKAKLIKNSILDASPEIRIYIESVKKAAEERGYIVNWLGRRCYFPNKNAAFKAPNYHTSGGCADVLKVAMNKIDELLLGYKSKMVMTIHDELPCEIHENDVKTVPKMIEEIMATAYPYKFVPLTVDPEWSDKSLGDKKKGYPV